MKAGPRNDLTDVPGVLVGQYQRIGHGWLTGTTVVVPPAGTIGGVDVRGGGPGTRETELLDPMNMVECVDAVCLSGGSSYGLAAASGVADWVGEQNMGFRVGPEPHHVVPIVPAAVLFDLGAGGRFQNRPTAEFGRRAADAAARAGSSRVAAPAPAHARWFEGRSGIGQVVLDDGTTVPRFAAMNSGAARSILARVSCTAPATRWPASSPAPGDRSSELRDHLAIP